MTSWRRRFHGQPLSWDVVLSSGRLKIDRFAWKFKEQRAACPTVTALSYHTVDLPFLRKALLAIHVLITFAVAWEPTAQ
ncbi:unnamed protein product [Angiostrongylus costaricensis]|uniref:Transposase n=1 Tax=Angiostrongylus costaricensis TaxID=334426 RepID=A0A0R3PH31_ANGCS|nr:unnamed protein product [Angiostrongylus costaricensis]